MTEYDFNATSCYEMAELGNVTLDFTAASARRVGSSLSSDNVQHLLISLASHVDLKSRGRGVAGTGSFPENMPSFI